ncbi:hypothetical protein SAMN06297129_2976 [Pseudooceanicola antarcticus]|uniref:Haemolysin XhlA n=1 Tax=Pseudooceanicola antarcticus TaxID=1247613 RepID=A0A285J7J7_9RHOB|nr:hypothetical protein [Pseudooceanicola antarcticus]PJE26806.1 hypothetical protein CVM39_15830 [Pseudooceanicola antarcticus]SNY55316.1 hypothetical protein SAMN06297129_2976 [Pseudooceanicola antarcticus]
MDEARLARIEEKLDKLSDAVVAMARMEEQMITLFKRMDRYDADQRELMRQVAQLERISIGRGAFFRSFDKAFWLALGGAASLLIGWLQTRL